MSNNVRVLATEGDSRTIQCGASDSGNLVVHSPHGVGNDLCVGFVQQRPQPEAPATWSPTPGVTVPLPIDREAATVFVLSSRGSLLPLTNSTCFCGEVVDLIHGWDDLSISRVNGDSKFGYEAYHTACCR